MWLVRVTREANSEAGAAPDAEPSLHRAVVLAVLASRPHEHREYDDHADQSSDRCDDQCRGRHSVHAAFCHRSAGLTDAEALVPGDVGLVDATETGVWIVVADDVLTLLESRAVARAVPNGLRRRAVGFHPARVARADDGRLGAALRNV